MGKTGAYRVTAVFRGRAYPGAETPTSAPIHTGVVSVGELNSEVHAGYGWKRDSGGGSLFTMAYASNASRVDFYITDWKPGHLGPDYAIASPSWGPHESGGAGLVPVGAWRVTRFCLARASEQAPLPRFNPRDYTDNLTLAAETTYVAVCTDTSSWQPSYALVRLFAADTVDGTVRVESWFQTIKGLRLIQH